MDPPALPLKSAFPNSLSPSPSEGSCGRWESEDSAWDGSARVRFFSFQLASMLRDIRDCPHPLPQPPQCWVHARLYSPSHGQVLPLLGGATAMLGSPGVVSVVASLCPQGHTGDHLFFWCVTCLPLGMSLWFLLKLNAANFPAGGSISGALQEWRGSRRAGGFGSVPPAPCPSQPFCCFCTG